MKPKKKRKLWKKLLVILAAVILVSGIGFGIYVQDYYRANDLALEAAAQSQQDITVTTSSEGRIIFAPENPRAGLIFYPGGKVQYEAYAPLMEACAKEGILCVLLRMPGNLAVLDINAAKGIPEEYPDIENWYMAGHSLGGSMAASYISSHEEEFKGLILLAAYSTADLKETGLKVLSLYGSEDGVLKMDSYEKYRDNLPEDFTEIVIPGGCHAYFGSYGPQEGDGTPQISNEEQIRFTANAIGLKLKIKTLSLGSFPGNRSPQSISSRKVSSSTVIR